MAKLFKTWVFNFFQLLSFCKIQCLLKPIFVSYTFFIMTTVLHGHSSPIIINFLVFIFFSTNYPFLSLRCGLIRPKGCPYLTAWPSSTSNWNPEGASNTSIIVDPRLNSPKGSPERKYWWRHIVTSSQQPHSNSDKNDEE